MTRTFALAPMGSLFRWISAVALAAPVLIMAGGVLGGSRGLLFSSATAGFMAAIYLFVWVRMRPSRFELEGDQLRIVFPMRQLDVDTSAVASAHVVDYEAFKNRYPRPIRVGAGGLWGGFGSLYTQNGKVQFYISRMEKLVLLEFSDGRRPLLISPERPGDFIEQLGEP